MLTENGSQALVNCGMLLREHYVVVLSVEGESCCAVNVIFPGYGDCHCNDIAVVKAEVISVEQLKTSMILLSHGVLMNPHVLAQLTHFACCQMKLGTNNY